MKAKSYIVATPTGSYTLTITDTVGNVIKKRLYQKYNFCSVIASDCEAI